MSADKPGNEELLVQADFLLLPAQQGLVHDQHALGPGGANGVDDVDVRNGDCQGLGRALAHQAQRT